MAALTCGVAIGFLPHNFHPARVFMGDGGALFLGLQLAAATMLIGGRAASPDAGQPSDVSGLTFFRFAPLFIPFVILGVPFLDMTFAVIRRTARRASFAERDLGHLHHRLIRLGHGHRRAVLILWGWTAVLSAFVLLPVLDSSANAFVPIGVGVFLIALYTLFRPAGSSPDAIAKHRHHPLVVETGDGPGTAVDAPAVGGDRTVRTRATASDVTPRRRVRPLPHRGVGHHRTDSNWRLRRRGARMIPAGDSGRGSTFADLLSIGGASAGCIAVGVGGGYWIGSSTGAGTVATLIGLALGIAGAVLVTYFKIKRSI